MGRKWIYPDAERRSLRRVRTIAEGKCRDLCIYFLLYICCTRCRAGLHCGMGCSRAVGEQGSALAVARPSPCLVEGVSARGSRAAERRLTRCSPRPQLPLFPWDLPGSGVEPASPAWAAGRRLPASSGGTNRELCSMSRGSRDGRGVWGSMVRVYGWLSPPAARLKPSHRCRSAIRCVSVQPLSRVRLFATPVDCGTPGFPAQAGRQDKVKH